MSTQRSNPRLPVQATPPPELVAPGSNGLPVRARVTGLSIVAASGTDAWMDAATVQCVGSSAARAPRGGRGFESRPTHLHRGIAYGLAFSAPFYIGVFAWLVWR